MLTIGITGPTGSGKTTLLECIAKRGGLIVDCDRLYDRLLDEDAALRAAIAGTFDGVFQPDGRLDRKKLAGIVFHDGAAMAKLNETVFLHVGRAVAAQLEAAGRAGRALAGVDAINLIESGLAARCDVTVCVTAPEKLRLTRIMARDALTQEEALARMRAQKDGAFYEANCRYHLINDGSEQEAFSSAADALLNTIIKENLP